MAILRQRLNRKNAGGSYDTIHLETESGLVLRSDGTTVEDALVANGVFSRMNATAVIASSDLAEDDLVLIGDADGSTVRKVTLSELATYFGTTAGNDPTTEFTILAQPAVLSVSNGSGGTPAKNLNDALTQMKDSYGLMYHYYRLQDALTGALYYVACESTIGSDTPSVTGSYVSTADPTKWYTSSTLNFLNTSNITADFTYLEEPVVESATGGSSVSTSGGSLDTTLIEMIKAYPNHKRYRLQNEGGTNYYILTTTTVNGDTESIAGAIYATATGTYYTGATIKMVSTIPDEFPDPDSLTVGNTINWANQQWIVSHKTADTCYLTLKGLSGNSTWRNLQSACTNFATKFTEAQKACLKSVTAGNTSGKVFVATKDQMDGGFSYFNNNSRRALNEVYWTSTEDGSLYAWLVSPDGSLGDGNYGQSYSIGFRPSVALDLTLLG